MFTDLQGYTSLAQEDEKGALRLLREFDELVRRALPGRKGRKVKSMGDGLLLEFPDVLNAVEAAVALQTKVRERNSSGQSPPITLRVGIHLGDVEETGKDILGDAVNIASRVEPLAEGGGVCVTSQVYDQVRNKVPYEFHALGPKRLKGLRESIEVHRLILPWEDSDQAASTESGPPRIAVLPLANISPDPKDEYFADGLTEEMISVLSQIKGLRVISRTSVGQYKGTTKSIGKIGGELGVGSVLEGSVRRAGDQLRITLQLIDVRTDEHRWAQTYDRRLDNVFAIQADVARQTAEALELNLLKNEREALQVTPTRNMEAYDAYLRGLEASRRYLDYRESESAAIDAFELAIRLDPGFSLPYAHLADFFVTTVGLTRPSREVFPRAETLITKALELNPASADAHMAKGNLSMQRDHAWSLAEEELRTAIRSNPSSSRALQWLAYLYFTLQRSSDAETQARRASELDPLWILPRVLRASILTACGKFGEAIDLLDKLHQQFGENRAVLNGLANAYIISGQSARAVQLTQSIPGPELDAFRPFKATILAGVGELTELRSLVDEWEQGKVAEYVALPLVATSYALLGDTEGALRLIEQDWRQGDRCLWAYYQAWAFDLIRDEPRFQTILTAMHLPTTLSRPLWTPLTTRKS